MEQEKEIQETELKEEKSKKIFIILTVLLLFGGTCYYYAGMNNSGLRLSHSELNSALVQQGLKPVINKSQTQKQLGCSPLTALRADKASPSASARNPQVQGDSLVQDDKTTIQNVDKKLEIEKTEKITPEKILKTKIKPTGKSDLLSLASKSSGKHDPFSYSESKFIPFASSQGENSSYSGNLPPVPGAGNMGTLPGLPGFNPLSSSGLANPPAPKPEDLIIVKGFIGNKVIAEIDGVVEALNANEKVSNVKVLNVNPSLLTAKFEINGKTVTKTIKSLTDEYNGEFQLVKNMHN
jgi:hypothetical protein